MARNIFDKVAVNEDQIVELKTQVDSASSLANFYILFGSMLWPNDRNANDHMVSGAMKEAVERAKFANDVNNMDCSRGFMRETFSHEIKKNSWHGITVGEAFKMYIECKCHGVDISIRKAQRLSIENSRGGRLMSNGSCLTTSEKTMKSSWRRFYNSVHIWAAYVIVTEIHQIRGKDLEAQHILEIAETANILSSLVNAKGYMKAAKTPWLPVIFTNTATTLEDYLIPAPSKEMIEILNSYSAGKKTIAKGKKLVPYAGG